MSTMQETKFKWFWAWQDDKQEAWFESMSRRGLHLITIKPFGSYVFEVGEPKKYTYRMDFDQSSGKDSDYFQLIEEAGWEHLTKLNGWQFWRKETGDGRTAELFTDNDSKQRKYKRLLAGLSSPGPAMIIIVLAMFKRFPGRHPQWFVISTISIFAVYLLFLMINLVMITQRIRNLEKTSLFENK